MIIRTFAIAAHPTEHLETMSEKHIKKRPSLYSIDTILIIICTSLSDALACATESLYTALITRLSVSRESCMIVDQVAETVLPIICIILSDALACATKSMYSSLITRLSVSSE